MTIHKAIACVGAAALALQAQAASAQAKCVTEAELSSAVIYVMPGALDAVGTRCAKTLSANGFFAKRSKAMAARYAVHQDTAWPGAKSLLLKFASKKGNGKADPMLDLLADAPAETLRPLIDAAILQKISTDMKVKDCDEIEKVAAALEPLEPKATGNLIAAIFAVAGMKDPTVCSS